MEHESASFWYNIYDGCYFCSRPRVVWSQLITVHAGILHPCDDSSTAHENVNRRSSTKHSVDESLSSAKSTSGINIRTHCFLAPQATKRQRHKTEHPTPCKIHNFVPHCLLYTSPDGHEEKSKHAAQLS